MIPRPHRYTLLPYTTLFRSNIPKPRNKTPNLLRRCLHMCVISLLKPPTRTALSVPVSTRNMRVFPDRKSTRLNSSHTVNSYAVFCLKKKHLDHADIGVNPHE